MAIHEKYVTTCSRPLLGRSDVPPRRHALIARVARIMPGLVLGCMLCPPVVSAQSPPTLSGNWQLACTGRKGQVRQISLRIEQRGSHLTGGYEGGRRSGQLTGSVRGNEVSLDLAGTRRSATLTGTADGNTLHMHGAKGISCTATRT